MSFQVGEIVRLKFSGPQMTVATMRDDGTVRCFWFDSTSGSYTLKHADFKPEMLDRIANQIKC